MELCTILFLSYIVIACLYFSYKITQLLMWHEQLDFDRWTLTKEILAHIAMGLVWPIPIVTWILEKLK